MTQGAIQELAASNIEEVKAAAEELSRLKGWNMKSVKGFISCLPVVIKHVEKVGEVSALNGADKNSLAVEIILKFIPLPWWLPVSIIRPLLEGAVNAVVEAINGKLKA
jgi:hypothetical protein